MKPVFGEPLSKGRMPGQRTQSFGKRGSISRRNKEPGVVVFDKLSNGRKVATHAAQPTGHRLHQHDRNSITVAIGTDAAGQSKDIRSGEQRRDVAVVNRTRKRDREALGMRFEVGKFRAIAGDRGMDGHTTGMEIAHGVDQRIETLFGDHSPK